jgi:hypothetical protein
VEPWHEPIEPFLAPVPHFGASAGWFALGKKGISNVDLGQCG